MQDFEPKSISFINVKHEAQLHELYGSKQKKFKVHVDQAKDEVINSNNY